MMLYQEIRKDVPQISSTQDTETEQIPLKKRQSIENALFDVEDDEQTNHVRIHYKQYIFISFHISFVKFLS
jgi:hypothetical protein